MGTYRRLFVTRSPACLRFACCVNVGGGEKLRLDFVQNDAVYGFLWSFESSRGSILRPRSSSISPTSRCSAAERLATVSRVLALGLPTRCDFRFDPPPLDLPFQCERDRDGKRLERRRWRSSSLAPVHAVRVSSWRWTGGREPELRETPPSVEELLELARSGSTPPPTTSRTRSW